MPAASSSRTVRYSMSPAFGRAQSDVRGWRSRSTKSMSARRSNCPMTSPAGPAPTMATVVRISRNTSDDQRTPRWSRGRGGIVSPPRVVEHRASPEPSSKPTSKLRPQREFLSAPRFPRGTAGNALRMPKFLTIGYGDRDGFERTDPAVRNEAHEHDVQLQNEGFEIGVAGIPTQVRNHDAAGVQTESGGFMRSELPLAGFAVI